MVSLVFREWLRTKTEQAPASNRNRYSHREDPVMAASRNGDHRQKPSDLGLRPTSRTQPRKEALQPALHLSRARSARYTHSQQSNTLVLGTNHETVAVGIAEVEITGFPLLPPPLQSVNEMKKSTAMRERTEQVSVIIAPLCIETADESWQHSRPGHCE